MAQVGRSMSATTSTTEGTSPVVASPAATPTPAETNQIPTAEEALKLLSKTDGTTLAEALALASSGNAPKLPAKSAPAAAPATEPEPAAPAATELKPTGAAPAATEPEAAKPATTPAEEENPQPEKLGKFRVSARDFKEAEFLRLSKSMPVPEAYAKVYGTEPAPAAAPAPAKTAEPAAAPVEAPAVADAKATLAKLEADLAKANEDADVAAATKLLREIGKVERTLERAEAEAAAAARAAEQAKATEADNTFRQREAAVIQDVNKRFPQLGDPASREEFQQFVNIKYDDPEYAAIFTSPRRFEVLAREFAEAKGWGKATAPAQTVGTPAPTPGAPAAPRVTAAEALTPGATNGGSGAIDARTALAELRKQGPEALFRALNGVTKT